MTVAVGFSPRTAPATRPRRDAMTTPPCPLGEGPGEARRDSPSLIRVHSWLKPDRNYVWNWGGRFRVRPGCFLLSPRRIHPSDLSFTFEVPFNLVDMRH